MNLKLIHNRDYHSDDRTLYVGCGYNAKFSNGDIGTACFDGDYIKVRKM